ncbi:unnamed protein product [Polarella glacialis]|uniref:Uncharacterized protein n=1 Tax=Polarella glacialis TaxID=89957 RepID=A0A813LU40_POLGL|nr:unnamed protein product [Polarella glacialis]
MCLVTLAGFRLRELSGDRDSNGDCSAAFGAANFRMPRHGFEAIEICNQLVCIPATAAPVSALVRSGSAELIATRCPAEVVEFVLDARYGDEECVKAALEARAEVDACSHGRSSALLMASANGHTGIVRLLLEARASTECPNDAGNRPLHWAALNGHLQIVQALLEAKADANVRNEFEKRPFDEAFAKRAAEGYVEVCEAIAKATNFEGDCPPDPDEGKAKDGDDLEGKDADAKAGGEKEAAEEKADVKMEESEENKSKAPAAQAKSDEKAQAAGKGQSGGYSGNAAPATSASGKAAGYAGGAAPVPKAAEAKKAIVGAEGE